MKFFAVVTASIVVFASFVAAAPGPEAADAAEVAVAADAEFSERSCVATKCRCNGIRGQFCGHHTVNPYCLIGHVYECNPSGATCDYGIRNSCVKCSKLVC